MTAPVLRGIVTHVIDDLPTGRVGLPPGTRLVGFREVLDSTSERNNNR